MEKSKFFSDKQFGFRVNRSTSKAAILLITKVMENIEKGLHVAGSFCDLSKAFDCVSPNKLKHKLEYYSIRGATLDLLIDFLTNKKHCVFFNNVLSPALSIDLSIEQGTILGPFLFITFINDLPDNISASIVLFADDSSFVNRAVAATDLKESLSVTQDQA